MEDAEKTYKQLVNSNINLIRERCWYYSGTDKRLFAELLHEVMCDLWASIDLYDPTYAPAQQRRWVRERCRGVYTRHRRLFYPSLLPRDEEWPEDISDQELRESVDELAEDLDAGERRLLELLLQGYNHGESARKLALSPAAVTKRYRRMIEKMKQRYKNLNL